MIFYDRTIMEEASFCDDLVSPQTGREYNYTYFIELQKQFSNRTLQDSNYFDYCVTIQRFKWWA